ncbi:MAG: hypothetical protein Q7S33_04945 [Nanoarchaeota archaeon]|nr:hypothetical protein [Nanoarchaeota archaeon]
MFKRIKKVFSNKFVLLIIITSLIILLAFYISPFVKSTFTANAITPPTSTPTTPSTPSAPPIKITYENFASMLSKNSMIQALPDNSALLLKFYNFNSGQRQWEKTYAITKSSVKEGNVENPDITILLSSKYLNELTTSNFCSIIKKAKANNDLGIETSLSTPSLLWKFKSMTKYKDCLGF